ncbi:MAG: DUF488 domain-containing protein [Gemmatimonadaceae bacterium]
MWHDSQVMRRPVAPESARQSATEQPVPNSARTAKLPVASARSGTLQPPGTLWTVGHSTHPIEEFLDMLTAHGITRIVDVRRFAGSRTFPQFNPAVLERSLGDVGISYTPLPELGGRRKSLPDTAHVAWRNESFRGYADYMDTPEFAAAAESLATLARADRVADMCSEAVWWRCHRSMIADYFKAYGWEVLHIMGAGDAKEHPFTPVAQVVDGQLTY